MQQRWFDSCVRSVNQRKEQELIHKWSLFILEAGGLFLVGIFLIKWLII
jgi:hypothetical protein